jgi:hypothetical protein
VHGFAGMAVLPPAGWLDALSRALLAALPASSADDCSRVSSIAVEPTTTTTSSSSSNGGGGGSSKSHHSAGQLDGQGLLMVSWAMARLGEQAGDRSPAMAPVGTPVQLLSAILSAPGTASLLWRAPEVAGPLLWACRRLGVLVPPPLLLDAAIYTLEASGRGSRGSNSSNRSSRSGSGRINRSNSSTSSSMIGGNGSQHGRGPDMLRRLAQSVALAAWAVSSWLGDGSCKDDIRARLLALLQANTALVRCTAWGGMSCTTAVVCAVCQQMQPCHGPAAICIIVCSVATCYPLAQQLTLLAPALPHAAARGQPNRSHHPGVGAAACGAAPTRRMAAVVVQCKRGKAEQI